MVAYPRSVQALFDITYYVVWITRYRYKVSKAGQQRERET